MNIIDREILMTKARELFLQQSNLRELLEETQTLDKFIPAYKK